MGLRELGWVEGRNLAFERRDASGPSDRLPALAADLLRANVDVIVAVGVPAIQAAKERLTDGPYRDGILRYRSGEGGIRR